MSIDQQPTASRVLSTRAWLIRLLVGAILLAQFALAMDAATQQSPTYDETAHVPRAYSIVASGGDFRLDTIHPPLLHELLACPIWAYPAQVELESKAWHDSAVFPYGLQFFYGLGNDAMAIIVRARMVIALLSAAFGLIIFAWSRRLHGDLGGLVSVALYAACPNVLAHSSLATTDMGATILFTCAVGSAWWAYRRPGLLSILLAMASMAALHAATLRALYAWPMVGILCVLLVLFPEMPEVGSPGRSGRMASRAGRLAALLTLQIAAAWFGLWAAYGFRYSAFEHHEAGDRLYSQTHEQALEGSWATVYGNAPRVEAIIEPLRVHRLLPEAYLYGIAHAMQDAKASEAFLDGEHSTTGFRLFFPKAFLYKTPLGTLALLALAATLGLGLVPGVRDRWTQVRAGLLRCAPLWVLASVYSAALVPTPLNLGLRYVLPVLPPLFILAGVVAAPAAAAIRPLRWIVPCLLGLVTLATLHVRPHYLAFFNTLAGGPQQGYRHLVDSSLDWGQDLIGLREWLGRNAGTRRVYLSYFGTAQSTYFGVDAQPIPHGWAATQGDSVFEPGIYCISATNLQQVFLLGTSEWTPALEEQYQALLPEMTAFEQEPRGSAPSRGAIAMARGREFAFRFNSFQALRFGRLCAWLRAREPDDQVGWSILIWDLDEAELAEALDPVHPPSGRAP